MQHFDEHFPLCRFNNPVRIGCHSHFTRPQLNDSPMVIPLWRCRSHTQTQVLAMEVSGDWPQQSLKQNFQQAPQISGSVRMTKRTVNMWIPRPIAGDLRSGRGLRACQPLREGSVSIFQAPSELNYIWLPFLYDGVSKTDTVSAFGGQSPATVSPGCHVHLEQSGCHPHPAPSVVLLACSLYISPYLSSAQSGETSDSVLMKVLCSTVSVAPSCPTLCNPIGCGPPGSSVHGILQARILE